MKSKHAPLVLAGAFGVGALAMYFADPDRGRRRRALVRDSCAHAAFNLQRFGGRFRRDLENRLQGAIAEHRDIEEEPVSDSILKQRIRTALGRVLSHPKAVQVSCTTGKVYLAGWVFTDEVDPLNQTVRAISGVKEVLTFVNTTDHPEHVVALQGGRKRQSFFKVLQESWSPTLRVLAGCAGSGLLLYGAKNRKSIGKAAVVNGALLLARSILNAPVSRILGADQTIGLHIQKTISVNASPKDLYEFWKNPENYPKMFGHVNRVTAENGGTFRWQVPGPGGIPVSWTGRIVEKVPDKLVQWCSTPDSTVANRGVVRLEPQKDGRTRMHVQMSYTPPAGFLGHAVASLLGLDPKTAMDEDFLRLKSLFEVGKTRVHGHEVDQAGLKTSPGSSGQVA
jgi:uncharacterized membrane protein